MSTHDFGFIQGALAVLSIMAGYSLLIRKPKPRKEIPKRGEVWASEISGSDAKILDAGPGWVSYELHGNRFTRCARGFMKHNRRVS